MRQSSMLAITQFSQDLPHEDRLPKMERKSNNWHELNESEIDKFKRFYRARPLQVSISDRIKRLLTPVCLTWSPWEIDQRINHHLAQQSAPSYHPELRYRLRFKYGRPNGSERPTCNALTARLAKLCWVRLWNQKDQELRVKVRASIPAIPTDYIQ